MKQRLDMFFFIQCANRLYGLETDQNTHIMKKACSFWDTIKNQGDVIVFASLFPFNFLIEDRAPSKNPKSKYYNMTKTRMEDPQNPLIILQGSDFNMCHFPFSVLTEIHADKLMTTDSRIYFLSRYLLQLPATQVIDIFFEKVKKFRFGTKVEEISIPNNVKTVGQLNAIIADRFELRHVAIYDRGDFCDPNKSLDLIKSINSNDTILVEPRKLFVRYGNTKLKQIDVSNCLTVASFEEEIKKQYPELNSIEFDLQFKGNLLDPNNHLKDVLTRMTDSNDVVQILATKK